MNFIDAFLDYTKECESPTSYFQWAAIASLSAVMRDNIFLHQGKLLIYPNLYIMILADSGVTRKGLPLKIAKKLIKKVDNTKLISGRSSIQGVIQELAKVEQNSQGLITKKGASGIFYAEEFASSLVSDPAAVNILTDIYDYHNEWENTLVGGKTKLEKVCFSMFVASNEVMLKPLFDNTALYGGLLGRTFIIYESKRRHKNSMVNEEPESKDADLGLINHLKALSKIKQRVTMAPEATRAFDEWYMAIDDETIANDKTGQLSRAGTLVAKLCLIFASADFEQVKSGKLEVTLQNFEDARELAFKVKNNQKRLTFGAGINPTRQQLAVFVSILKEAEGYCATRKSILAKHWTDFDVDILDKMVNQMLQAGLMRSTVYLNEEAYQLTEYGIKTICED